MIIRKAIPQQAREISDLIIETQEKLLQEDYTPEQREVFARKNTPEKILVKMEKGSMYCAMQNGAIIGVVCFSGNELERLYVRINHTREGIGSKLLAIAERKALEIGFKTMSLFSTPSAVTYYKIKGYSLIEEGTIKVEGVNLPKYIMEKPL